MCGIAGYQTHDGKPLPETVLDQFTNSLAHRGPDGTGRYISGGTGLAQTRLAVIDLETGDQPLFSPDGTALVANGEIYNYVELREEFSGAKFATNSDCELPLFTYGRDQNDFARSLDGMYAIALIDNKTTSLHLARDPFGIKPLYYAPTDAGLLFASEPRALFASGLIEPRLDAGKATELLQLQFTTSESTIYHGVARVAPGASLELRNGTVIGRNRLQAVLPGQTDLDEEDSLKALDRGLMETVEKHQRSDVPYGMFLSGGIDSSALLACMARLNERPVTAFTAWFPGSNVHDEREHAKRVARAAGANHIEVAVTEDDFWNNLPAIVAAMDDPVADYAIIPTYLLAREAAKDLKVVLSGEGGDEVFAGYGRYRRATRPHLLGGRKMYAKGTMAGLGILRDESPAWRAGIRAAEERAAGMRVSRLQEAQCVDIDEWLPNDLLIKLDRCLMAHGVEGRTPFLGAALGSLAFMLPDNLKLRNGMGKYLLRRWLEKALPEAEPFSKKRGFTVPVGGWITPHAAALAPMVAGNEGVSRICNADEVARLFRSASPAADKQRKRAIWHLLFFALWHRIHIEGADFSADVMTLLGDRN
jgi:asparagine synthase (glutamine-hydrolysing)